MAKSSDTIVLVSGANQGIGYEIVKKLAQEQPNFHILLGARSLSKGQEAAESLHDLPGLVEAIQLDVSSDDSINACADQIEKTFGHLDVLINNAGISIGGVSDKSNLRKVYNAILETNVTGTAILTETCIPLLRKSPSKVPRIIFISSEMGSVTNTLDPNFPYYGFDIPHYKASKAAMNQLGAVLAVRLGKEGFKINMCCPGLRKTGFNNYYEKGGDPAEGAINACRLAVSGPDGEHGTFSNIDGKMPW